MKRILNITQHADWNSVYQFYDLCFPEHRWLENQIEQALVDEFGEEPDDDYWRGRLHIIVEVEDSDPHP